MPPCVVSTVKISQLVSSCSSDGRLMGSELRGLSSAAKLRSVDTAAFPGLLINAESLAPCGSEAQTSKLVHLLEDFA